MWSVLNLDAELESLALKEKSEGMKVSKTLMKEIKKPKTTPVKTPKTRGQKKVHTKVRPNHSG